MDFFKRFTKHQYLISAVLLFFMVLALVLRAIPALFIHDAGFLYILDTDSYYTLRQIEVMVHNFPQYNWFDPMTAFPEGKTLDWGPLFPFIAATLCIITGATTRDAIFFMSGWVVPLMAMMMVPVMYFLGRRLWNGSAGLAAAGMIAIISIYYFSISSYGWTDHHVAEVLFSTVFILIYCSILDYIQKNPVDIKKGATFIFPILFSIGAGIFLFLALLSSTTVILVLLVIAIYTAIQYILDYYQGNNSNHILIANVILLSVTSALLLLFGIKQPGTSLTQYTIGVVYVHYALIGETVVLAILSKGCSGKKWLYTCCLVVLAIGGFFLIQTNPQLNAVSSQALGLVFGSSTYAIGIVETLPWTLPNAWENFNFSLILALGGLLSVGYALIKKRESNAVFLVVWSVVMLLMTIQYQRFQYFFTVNIALLAAICIAEALTMREEKLRQCLASVTSRLFPSRGISTNIPKDKSFGSIPKKNKKREQKRPVHNPANTVESLKDILLIIVIIITAAFVVSSLSQDIGYVLATPGHTLSPDWIDSLKWLGANSPDTGIDYYQSYDAKGFSYPSQAYGILAVWDAGHWITVFSHRIPITNPFQNNLDGANGGAAYFLSTNESKANPILEKLGGKYIVTNSDMAVDTFTNLVPWQSGTVDISQYIKWFMMPDTGDSSYLLKVHRYVNGYFQTMVVRLHVYDGSMTDPGSVQYTKYVIRQVPAAGETAGDVNGYARVITQERPIKGSHITSDTPIIREGSNLLPQGYADLFSDKPYEPIEIVPALQHYRLIHESMNNATVAVFPESAPATLPDIKYVKIFEYVNGAYITGDGIIEVPVVTNTGRAFVYRQESVNGEFVVPYSTTGNHYEVKTTGPYHIAGTSRYITVTEDDVMTGNLVKG
ncbi:MAG: oligosaccharyl transferase, archaeosortase A system-associated [Methanoregula sp.]|nr:oligosaccharyl transferase, archaeosortase A system-associated [Methanoregula sp.]